jgi:hypothetical protein
MRLLSVYLIKNKRVLSAFAIANNTTLTLVAWLIMYPIQLFFSHVQTFLLLYVLIVLTTTNS